MSSTIVPGQALEPAVIEDPDVLEKEGPHPVGSGRSWGFHIVSQAMLMFWAVLVIFPFVWMIYSSFKTEREIGSMPFHLPSELQWDNFSRAWNAANIDTYVFNTLIVMSMSLTGPIILSAMAAYVISRFDFPGNRFIFILFTAGLMFPMFLGLVPLYFLMSDLNLRDTYHGLALVYIAYSLPFTIFFLMGFFKTLPTEVAEASVVDGASHVRELDGKPENIVFALPKELRVQVEG